MPALDVFAGVGLFFCHGHANPPPAATTTDAAYAAPQGRWVWLCVCLASSSVGRFERPSKKTIRPRKFRIDRSFGVFLLVASADALCPFPLFSDPSESRVMP